MFFLLGGGGGVGFGVWDFRGLGCWFIHGSGFRVEEMYWCGPLIDSGRPTKRNPKAVTAMGWKAELPTKTGHPKWRKSRPKP